MKIKIQEEIGIPEGVTVSMEENIIELAKGPFKLRKIFEGFKIKQENNKIILYTEKATKREKKLIMTFKAHINNMIKGLAEKFVYKLQIASVHFPVTVSIEGNQLLIKNFLGEVTPRKAKILPEVEVKVEKDIITVESNNIEAAGQTAANIEKATKVKGRDRRIFQDGIYITEKPGREI
ncbi:MAG: 50S ribosomal protein L6 [archaeon]